MKSLQERVAYWRKTKLPHHGIELACMKLAEESGETIRAVLGHIEKRPNRGDPVKEAAQTVIVLLSLVGQYFPDEDLMTAVEIELQRLEAMI